MCHLGENPAAKGYVVISIKSTESTNDNRTGFPNRTAKGLSLMRKAKGE